MLDVGPLILLSCHGFQSMPRIELGFSYPRLFLYLTKGIASHQEFLFVTEYSSVCKSDDVRIFTVFVKSANYYDHFWWQHVCSAAGRLMAINEERSSGLSLKTKMIQRYISIASEYGPVYWSQDTKKKKNVYGPSHSRFRSTSSPHTRLFLCIRDMYNDVLVTQPGTFYSLQWVCTKLGELGRRE